MKFSALEPKVYRYEGQFPEVLLWFLVLGLPVAAHLKDAAPYILFRNTKQNRQ